MTSAFVHRYERFSAPVQILLGAFAFVIALSAGMLVPTPPLVNAILVFVVLAPLSILLVVAVASSVQRARNTLAAHQADTWLTLARHGAPIERGTLTLDSDPAWSDALRLIDAKEKLLLASGRRHLQFTPGGVICSSAAEKALGAVMINDWTRRLEGLRRAAHPTVANAQVIHETENEIHLLVGETMRGVDIEAMRSCVDLDREFTTFTDCQNGHWDIHNLESVFTAKGGQRRVQRSCVNACGSRWTEKI